MKRRSIHIILLLLFAHTVFAQEIEVRPGDFLYGMGAGANFGKVNVNPANEVKSSAMPFVGLSASYALSYRWRANFAGYFSMRSSVVDNYFKMDQTGLDVQGFLQYKVDDLYFNFGLQSQSVLTYRASFRGNSNFGTSEEIEDYTVPAQQFNPLLGVEFKLVDNWRFFANYSFSPGETYSCTQIGLAYRINKRSAPPESARKIKRRVAQRQIKELRNGALLVRLKTSEPSIKAMEKRGYHQMAEEKEKQQREENLSLMKSFKSAYTFSELKFFYSTDSRKVLEGDYEGVFLNDSLERDPAITLHNPKNTFICELTNIEQDTTKIFSHYELVQTGNFAAKQVPRFYGGTEHSFYALVIKDDQLNQLSKPFPYYSRALFKSISEHPGHGIFYIPLKLFFSDTPLGSVRDLNDKLFRYWNRNK